MDDHSIRELELLVSADMRANDISFEASFAKAIAPFPLEEKERERIARIVREKISMTSRQR